MITIETWAKEAWPDGTLALKASTFVRHNNKRVDPWFARYVQGKEPSRYPMPAIPYHWFGNLTETFTITIWPGVIQYRISDDPYTGFGKVITIEHGVRCEARYDDFN